MKHADEGEEGKFTAHTSLSVSTSALIDVVILDEDSVSPNNKAGCNKDKSAE
jgi:hypothetical protein